ncbi:hypothetical protein AtubIFM55763_006551 [Aspergillus tubingensis]|uniref:Uncharacterized protein n=2 Tax=Aspergillus subgen. Circumdati TaxID=2720871 RepID=A0A100IPQ2_ASPNG|nr:uncharacterized protein AtWU_08121 [Aspergillus tubingensis]GAQ45103.1 hypothetical protein AKAW_06216 [Aspergillus niger]GFN18318.1 hypothetical protein AtWU_08121 [Aspergillus tubingensis]GLA75281.1 hypothetical protein AtubIFM55763_006551 [Aspergillus tubingensis]GLA79257.1 hypothetical protein AtubIFM56815_000045 [Aspergillus tubingensis]GLA99472.1 hypothetical protein AtubIFM57143_008162 [Aspergillus tubingensis]
MSDHDVPAFDVYFVFQKQELKLVFNSATHANAYQASNREGRIFTAEPTAVYLPHSPAMTYLRDSSNGLVIGFATSEDAETWCRTSILGHIYSSEPSPEVRIRRNWTDEELDEVLRIQSNTNVFRKSVPFTLRPAMPPSITPPASTSSSSTTTSRAPSGQFAPPPWAQVSLNLDSESPPATTLAPLSQYQLPSTYSPVSDQPPRGSIIAYPGPQAPRAHSYAAPSETGNGPAQRKPIPQVDELGVAPLRPTHISPRTSSTSLHRVPVQ